MIEVHAQRWFRRRLHTRIPFHYGIAVMEEVPHVWLELEATVDGERVKGRAADHLPPKWFTKNPSRPIADEVTEMSTVLRQASLAAAGQRGDSVHAVIRAVEEAQAATARCEGWPPLLAHFGVSLVERALIDAYCRRHGCTVDDAVRKNGLGLRLEDLHPELAGMDPADGLPAAPLDQVDCRHTVGLADPLEAGDTGAVDGPRDGWPVDLRAVIRTYGLREFKIKVAGEIDTALDRLERVLAVIESECGEDYAATLDGNESFRTVADLRNCWEAARPRPGLRGLWPRLRFFEQPLHRDVALGEDVAGGFAAWPDRPPMLIDESGGEPADLRRALAIGYAGVSHKNCKGVIHGVANRCLLSRRGPGLLMSGEDLSNVGPVALPQDLAVQALLGNASVERNGHHYFAGLSGWPSQVQAVVRQRYAGLYGANADGMVCVQVKDGLIDTRPAVRHAFGGAWDLGLDGAGEFWAEIS